MDSRAVAWSGADAVPGLGERTAEPLPASRRVDDELRAGPLDGVGHVEVGVRRDLVAGSAHEQVADLGVTAARQVQQHVLRQRWGAVGGGGPAPLLHVLVGGVGPTVRSRQHRRLLADAFEVVDGPLDFRRMGDGQEVQHRVGRAAEGHHHGDGVLEGGLGHDLASSDALAQHLDDRLARPVGEAVAASVDRRRS